MLQYAVLFYIDEASLDIFSAPANKCCQDTRTVAAIFVDPRKINGDKMIRGM